MNLDQFYYVREILQTKSITIASENLHVTQSAISQSLTMLEKEVGIPLFKRSRSGTIPTEDGKHILYKILEILTKVDELQGEILAIQSTLKGKINIATVPSVFMTQLPRIVIQFQSKNPHVKINIHEMDNSETFHAIQHEKMDVGFVALFNNFDQRFTNQIRFQPMGLNGAFSVIVHKNSKLSLKDSLTMKDIQNEDFILYDSTFYNMLIDEFKREAADLKIIFKTTNTEVIKRTVMEGLGISIISDIILKNDPYMNSGEIKAIPLQFHWTNKIEFGTIHKQNNVNLHLIEKFLKYI